MTNHLYVLGYEVNRKHVRRSYRKMDLYAIGPRPKTSKPHKGKGLAIYPYLLRDLTIDRSNQVWEMDISFIPLRGSHMYLVPLIDVFNRFIVGCSLSYTIDRSQVS